MAWSFAEKTVFGTGDPHKGTAGTAFTDAQKASILAAMQTAYDGSNDARTMFENWVAAGKTFKINSVDEVNMYAYGNSGETYLNFSFLTNATYINNNGTAVKDTLLTCLVHELGHALTGKRDNFTTTEYKGDNVKFVNEIYKDLGLSEQNSYISYDTTGLIHTLNYKYTNGAAIDASESGNRSWNSGALGNSKDLLIGGAGANTLETGQGNDFLFGAAGDDVLRGGDGRDTGIFLGDNPADYDVRKNADGSWTVRHVRGAASEGTDRLENVEVLQFNQTRTFDLKKNGLTFQTDFAFVIDTTGSMGDDIGAVKAQATTILNALFANNRVDAQVGVVSFKDTTNGEPSRILLPFTTQDSFADRKAAAIAAINAIGVGGGGDTPETANDGLVLALKNLDWRVGAAVHRIALFTDAPVKDTGRAGEVAALAANLGATITSRTAVSGRGGMVETYELALPAGSTSSGSERAPGSDPNESSLPPFVSSGEAITPDTTTATLQVFTIFTGPEGTDISGLTSVAAATGGSFLTAPDPDDLVGILLDIIEIPPDQTRVGSEDDDILDGGEGNDVLVGLGGNDILRGHAGMDTLVGGPGRDTAIGGSGNDAIAGGAGNDLLLGEDGVDWIEGGDGDDVLSGGEGNDVLLGQNGADWIEGGNGADAVAGGAGNDVIFGGAGNDWLEGNAGNDSIIGGAGNDRLQGDAGNDYLVSQGGFDYLLGGSGNDVFEFSRGDMQAGNFAVIGDFGKVAGDFDGIILLGFAGTQAYYQDGSNVLIYSTDLGLSAGIVVPNITVAELGGHLLVA